MKRGLLIGILLSILFITSYAEIMNTRILIMLLIVLLVGALLSLVNGIKDIGSNRFNQANKSEIPNSYEARYARSISWLDQKTLEWKPTEYKPMKFNGHLLFASEEMIDVTAGYASPKEMDEKFLEMFDEMGVDTLSLFIYPDMFEKYKDRYGSMISRIRSMKKQLYVAYMVGGGNGFKKFSSFKEYKDTERDFTKMFVEKYKPDYYAVVDEITTMERRTGLDATDEEWGKLVLEMADLVKNISPETKVVATGHSQELGFLKALADNVKNLDMIGLNLWGTDQIDETTKIGKNFRDTIAYVRSRNKEVVLEQTWFLLHDSPEAKKMSVLDELKEPDAKYITVLGYYANRNDVSIYSPFYIGKFIEYGIDPVKFKASFESGERTPAFFAYKSLIEEFKKNRD